MNIIAFDLSLHSTGYSIFNDNKLLEIGSIPTDPKKILPVRLKKIADAVKKLKKTYKPDKIIFERGFSRFNNVTQILFRVFGVINYLFYDIEQIYIPAKTVRKLICGQGNIKKNDFFLYMQKKYKSKGIKFQNNDEADSYALGLAYLKQEKSNGRKKTTRNKR